MRLIEVPSPHSRRNLGDMVFLLRLLSPPQFWITAMDWMLDFPFMMMCLLEPQAESVKGGETLRWNMQVAGLAVTAESHFLFGYTCMTRIAPTWYRANLSTPQCPNTIIPFVMPTFKSAA